MPATTDHSKKKCGMDRKMKYRVHGEYFAGVIGNTWRGISSWRSRDGITCDDGWDGMGFVLWLSGWGFRGDVDCCRCWVFLVKYGAVGRWTERWGRVPFPGVANKFSCMFWYYRNDQGDDLLSADLITHKLSLVTSKEFSAIVSFTYPSSRLRWQSWIPPLAAASVAAEPRNQSCHPLLVVVYSCLHLLHLRLRSIFR